MSNQFEGFSVGDVDDSGTWANGKTVGSPEWTEAQLSMRMVKLMLEEEFGVEVESPEKAYETGIRPDGSSMSKTRTMTDAQLERAEHKMDAGEANPDEVDSYFSTVLNPARFTY